MEQVFLSRKNLITLLEKLDKKKSGIPDSCTIIKHDGQGPNINQTMPICAITAVEDIDYYYEGIPGKINPQYSTQMEE